ncbi:hypothetical protein Tco_0509119, partial [Tanacetum coccineum]
GEVNPTRAYYNGSCTSKDTEDPSWSTSFKTRRTRKTSSALEDFICVVFVHDRNISNGLATPFEEALASRLDLFRPSFLGVQDFLKKSPQRLDALLHCMLNIDVVRFQEIIPLNA